MANGEPKTVRELYFWMKGEFDTINSKLRLVFLIGGIAGSVFGSLVILIFKFFGGIQ